MTRRLPTLRRCWEQTFMRARAFTDTVRGRILVAFLIMSLITAALGVYATLGISRAGLLVTRTYDQSLMSINYARAAAADFAGMEAAFARRWLQADTAGQKALDDSIETLNQSLAEDLAIAVDRSQSDRARQAAVKVRAAVAAWNAKRHEMVAQPQQLSWVELDRDATTVADQIDLLVNYTAGDGFTYRQYAREAVGADMRVNIGGTIFAVLLSGFVAMMLARRIIGPVAAASSTAARIAAGHLDGPMPNGGQDEIGRLLRAMDIMRNNIRAMMEREVAQRRSAQARLADAIGNSQEGVMVVDAERRIALANRRAAECLGLPLEALRPGTSLAKVAQHLQPGTPAEALLDADGGETMEIQLPDGRWMRVSRSETQEGGFIAFWTDVSALKRQKQALQATNLTLDAALDNMSQGLCLYGPDNRLKVANRRFCELFHLDPRSVVPGRTHDQVLSPHIASGRPDGDTLAELFDQETRFVRRRVPGTYVLELSGNRAIAVAHEPMPDGGWVATYEDVTERRRSERQIAFMARHDALTNLPNRLLLGERIDEALARLGRDAGFAVLCLDLDQFKQVNDTLGHPVGDSLLRLVGERLQACVRESDTVARLGGDEFAVIQTGVEKPEDASLLARRIVEVVSEPYDIEGHRVTVGVSIGIALAPWDSTINSKLLKNADVALYRAKADGRGVFRFFEMEMDTRLQARRALELDLREALDRGEFELFYQPLYDIALDRICGFEALVRWHHKQRGIVSPAEFVPLMEEIGLIIPLGEWALRSACATATHWPAHIKVAVNVSPAQFKNGTLVEAVRQALVASGLSPRRLELEITESVLLANSATTLAVLHSLRGLGVRISMDDFGTGYSSLSYLRSFPFDKIKIDKSFIDDITAEGGSAPIVRAVTALGASLGMRTTAEGVETAEQLAWLRSEGCHEAQGYLFSPAVPASAIPRLLATARRPVAAA